MKLHKKFYRGQIDSYFSNIRKKDRGKWYDRLPRIEKTTLKYYELAVHHAAQKCSTFAEIGRDLIYSGYRGKEKLKEESVRDMVVQAAHRIFDRIEFLLRETRGGTLSEKELEKKIDELLERLSAKGAGDTHRKN